MIDQNMVSDTLRDSLVTSIKEFSISPDSLFNMHADSLVTSQDTLIKPPLDYKLSPDAIDDDVRYSARDSSRNDMVNQRVYLYGDATIDYQSINMVADSIIIDFKNSILHGFESLREVSGEKKLPTFRDGINTFNFREIEYNFKTKKGIVTQVLTTQGEFNMVGSTTKYISGSVDSTGVESDAQIYNKDIILTTCNHVPPHFGIRAHKLKLIPGKVAALSVAQLEIAGVPTPLVVPFAFFPLIQGRSSGIIFPSGYEYNRDLGLGFREVGYYFPVSNYMDLKITGDIYTRGTWGVRVNSSYKKRYGYTGNITLGFANNIMESPEDGSRLSQKSFLINIRHDQDAKAHPYRKIGGSVNIQSNRYDQRVYENPAAALTNQYSSNFSFSHEMPGTPFRFSAEMRHSQNTQTRQMEITLPNMTLRMNTIYPFKPKNVTKEKWTHKIAFSYNSEFRNFVRTTDTTLFTRQTLDDIQTGLRQRAGLNTNFRVLKYFNLSPNINYEETWLTKQYELTFNPDSVRIDPITGDTLGFKAPESAFISKLTPYRNLNTGVSLQTQIFGTIKGGRGFFRGVRHVMKPTVSFVFSPENKERYEALVDTDVREDFNQPRSYNILSNGPFGSLSGSPLQMGINYSIINIIEGKYFSKRDSTEKKLKIFDNISINGNYNFAADSFKLSPISVAGNTRILKGLTNFTFRAMLSPYVYDNDNKITHKTVWQSGKVLPELRTFGGQFSTGISFGQIREILGVGKKHDTPPGKKPEDSNKSALEKENETSLADWFEGFRISHSLNFQYNKIADRDTFFISSHSINFSGTIPLSKMWNMNIGNIAYDFKHKSFVYPYFSFYRDLHCWQMNFTWAPANGVYSFFIGVKSSALEFLKYDYGQRNANTLFTGQR